MGFGGKISSSRGYDNRASFMNDSTKNSRLVARVNDETNELIKNAAQLAGLSLSQFIIEATTDKAHYEIERNQRVKLSFKNAMKVFELFDNPPAPNMNLTNAAKRYKEMYAGTSNYKFNKTTQS